MGQSNGSAAVYAQSPLCFVGNVILPDSILNHGVVVVRGSRIEAVGPTSSVSVPPPAVWIDCSGYVAPGLVDLHVHGGAGADFMDGTRGAFETVIRAHAGHGTTSIVPTSTVARNNQILRFLELTRDFRNESPVACRVLGAHFYGPYFGTDARGCHPAAPLRSPDAEEYGAYLAFSESILTATIAPELPGAEQFVKECTTRGICANAGHSHATFNQMAAA